MKSLRFLTFFFVLLLTLPALAQETSTQPITADSPLPASAHLSGMTMVWQNLNRCSAAALTIQLSYFDAFTGDYTAMIRRLNPNAEDMSVRLEEMIPAAQMYGLYGVVRRGGTIDLLKRLVVAGFPVLIENSYYDGDGGVTDWMSHNRVVAGYDDAAQEFLFMDSLLGDGDDDKGVRRAYDDTDERWRAFNRDYLVIYKPEDQEKLQAVLGDQWDTTFNAQWTLEQAQADLAAHDDGFTHYNIGWAQYHLGQYEAAAESFDTAIAKGLPWRYFWYEYTVLDAYLKVGRYDEVATIARKVIGEVPGVEESYYYIGLAYEGQGNTERAIANMEAALFRNPHFTEAQTELNRMGG